MGQAITQLAGQVTSLKGWFMNNKNSKSRYQEAFLEELAAELTDAAYQVALHHGVVGASVDLELALWHTLGDKVREWKQDLPPCQ
jgi:hypothetical protein